MVPKIPSAQEMVAAVQGDSPRPKISMSPAVVVFKAGPGDVVESCMVLSVDEAQQLNALLVTSVKSCAEAAKIFDACIQPHLDRQEQTLRAAMEQEDRFSESDD